MIVIALLYSKVCVATVVPVFEYDVPVASQPLVYAPHPYVGSYAVRQPHAISHSYSQTQTHPVTYLKPVSVFLCELFSFSLSIAIALFRILR